MRPGSQPLISPAFPVEHVGAAFGDAREVFRTRQRFRLRNSSVVMSSFFSTAKSVTAWHEPAASPVNSDIGRAATLHGTELLHADVVRSMESTLVSPEAPPS
jgi:hypothetical protein